MQRESRKHHHSLSRHYDPTIPAMNRPGFLAKAGLRKLLTSEEVWTFGMKRSSGEQDPTGRANLQKSGPKDQDVEPKKKVRSCSSKKHPCENLIPSNSSRIHPEEQKRPSARKLLKTKHRFTPEPLKILERAATVSSGSRDIEEELRYDHEDRRKQPEEHTRTTVQKEYPGPTDNVALNVQNRRRSEGALLNNNLEICDESRKTSYTPISPAHDIDSALVVSTKLEEPVKDRRLTNLIQAVNTDLKGGDESPFCENSLSAIEDVSEPSSLQSDEPICSEEEKEQDLSLVYAEKFLVLPELFPYCSQNHPTFTSGGHSYESNLSEILSPVDEILSYGSAELPSVKGGAGSGALSTSLPPPLPPPAFEIITWTSEDDPPAPHEEDLVEDTSINSEDVPQLPVDLCLSKTRVMDETIVTDQEDDASEYNGQESHDLLSSYCIGDRVQVCSSKPGVLKYKGQVAFASGFWTGAAIEESDENHDGTFLKVKNFTCEKNHGVLMRAEDVSHLHPEHCSNLDLDTFSDNGHGGQNGRYNNKPSGNHQGRKWDGPGQNFSGSNQMFSQELCEDDPPKDNTPTSFSRFNIFDLTSPLKVDHTLVRCNGNPNGLADPDDLTVRLTGEILADASTNGFRKKEPGSFMTHKPCLMDQWQPGYSVSSPQIQIQPHENNGVYRLVDLTVEMLCGQESKSALDACETPKYLVDNKGRNTYRQVLFHLASGILHEVCADILEMRGISSQNRDKTVMLERQTSHVSVELLKAAVRKETLKVLNLERTDHRMTEMLRTLCKFWNAKRDRVDHILIQELYSEEKHWVDYRTDQTTVKIRMAEEIFFFLLDDTITVLNLIYITGNK